MYHSRDHDQEDVEPSLSRAFRRCYGKEMTPHS